MGLFRPSRPVSVVLVGIGGYGQTYVEALLDRTDRSVCRLVGVVDPSPERCTRLADLSALSIPVYRSLTLFYEERRADLAVIASPIHFHASQTCEALAQGSHVLCEKPLGATIQEAWAMIEARDRARRQVAIGYQWSFSAAVQALKRDVLAGRFGVPRRLKTLCLWPRNAAYYARSPWAGALRDAEGRWVLDSPVNNATAHYLHHMFYLVGPRLDRSARPVHVTAELYRANRITNYDTGAVRGQLDNGAEFLFLSSHAVERSHGPEACFEFEEATLSYGGAAGPEFVVRFRDGTSVSYGNPHVDGDAKLWTALQIATGEGSAVCGPEAALSQTLCMNGMQESAPIVELSGGWLAEQGEGGQRVIFIKGLADVLLRCYQANALPSELDVAWALPGETVDLRSYDRFPSRALPIERKSVEG